MGLIYGNTNHPVEIKKIALKIWALRKEIETQIRLEVSEDKLDDKAHTEKVCQFIRDSYSPLNTDTAAPAPAEAAEEEEEEDEFSKAMAEAIENPDAPADDAAENSDSDDSEEAAPKDNVYYLTRPRMEDSNITEGVCLLSDLSMNDLCFFSKGEFAAGQTIIINFEVPSNFSVSCEVLSCKNYNLHSRIISPTRASYRIHARFVFLKKGERTLLRRFLKSIEPEIPAEVAKAVVKNDDDDDLADLDLGI